MSYRDIYPGPTLLSRPIKLHWAGWDTDTLALQQAGWLISANQNFDCRTMQIALRHDDLKISGITHRIDFDYFKNVGYNNFDFLEKIIIPTHLASKLYYTFKEFSYGKFDYFSPIDAMPQVQTLSYSSIEEFAHFAVPLCRTQQIIVPDTDIQSLLDKILELQEPRRNEYFKKIVEDEKYGLSEPRQKIHAQIISLVA